MERRISLSLSAFSHHLQLLLKDVRRDEVRSRKRGHRRRAADAIHGSQLLRVLDSLLDEMKPVIGKIPNSFDEKDFFF